MAAVLLREQAMSLKMVKSVIAAALSVLSTLAVPNQVQVGYGATANQKYGQYQAGIAGEFTLNPLGNSGPWLDLSGYAPGVTRDIGVAGTFQTFCLEYNEHIYPYPTIYDVTLSSAAMSGGAGGGPNGDPLSKGTGWLYARFAQGTLTGYNYGGTEAAREASAILLQKAFWMLEQEQPVDLANIFIAQLLGSGDFANVAAAMATGADEYGVSALNLSHPTKGRGQDQLYYQPVPEAGATILTFGLVLGGLVLVRNRASAAPKQP